MSRVPIRLACLLVSATISIQSLYPGVAPRWQAIDLLILATNLFARCIDTLPYSDKSEESKKQERRTPYAEPHSPVKNTFVDFRI